MVKEVLSMFCFRHLRDARREAHHRDRSWPFHPQTLEVPAPTSIHPSFTPPPLSSCFLPHLPPHQAPVDAQQPASLFSSTAKPHRLSAFFSLIFRYASVHHPLMASALARIVEDKENRGAILKDDSAMRQIVSMILCDSKHVVSGTH